MRCAFVLGLIGLSTGCGRFGFASNELPPDSGADAPVDNSMSPDGFWVLQSAHEIGGGPARERADLVSGIRGDVTIANGVAHERFILLANGAAGAVQTGRGTISVSDDQWISTIEGTTSVYDLTSLSTDAYLLLWNADDPRNVGTPPFDTVTIARDTPPTTAVVGDRAILRIEFPGTGEFASGACAPDGDGMGNTQKVDGQIAISPDTLLLQGVVHTQYFTGAGCPGSPSSVVDRTLEGYLEVQDAEYRVWLNLVGLGEVYTTGTFTLPNGGLRLVRGTCTPQALCDDQLPLTLTM